MKKTILIWRIRMSNSKNTNNLILYNKYLFPRAKTQPNLIEEALINRIFHNQFRH